MKLLDICNSHEFILLCHIIPKNREEEKNEKKKKNYDEYENKIVMLVK